MWKAKCVFAESKNKICLSVETCDVYFNGGFPKKVKICASENLFCTRRQQGAADVGFYQYLFMHIVMY